MGTVRSSVKLTDPKPEIDLVRAPSRGGGARNARDVLVSLAQQSANIPKTANGIRGKLEQPMHNNVTMVDNAPNINVTIAGEMRTLTTVDANALVTELNKKDGAQIPFGDRHVTCDGAGAISLVAVPAAPVAINFDAATQDRKNTFLAAAQNGSLTATQIQAFIEGGIEIDTTDASGNTALHTAAFKGHDKVVKKLLEKDANMNAVDKFGNTPLDVAIRSHAQNLIVEGHKNTVEFILNHYAETFGGRFEINRNQNGEWMYNYKPPNGTQLNVSLTNAQAFINQINEMRDCVPAETSFNSSGLRFTFGHDKKITNIEKID